MQYENGVAPPVTDMWARNAKSVPSTPGSQHKTLSPAPNLAPPSKIRDSRVSSQGGNPPGHSVHSSMRSFSDLEDEHFIEDEKKHQEMMQKFGIPRR